VQVRGIIAFDVDRLAAQQVLDLHLPDLADLDTTVEQFVHAGDGLESYRRRLAQFFDLTYGLPRSRGDSDKHDAHAHLGPVVVHVADGLQADVRVVAHLAGDHGPRIAGAHNDDATRLLPGREPAVVTPASLELAEKADREADAADEKQGQQPVYDQHRAGKACKPVLGEEQAQHQSGQDACRQDRSAHDAQHLGHAGVAPVATV